MATRTEYVSSVNIWRRIAILLGTIIALGGISAVGFAVYLILYQAIPGWWKWEEVLIYEQYENTSILLLGAGGGLLLLGRLFPAEGLTGFLYNRKASQSLQGQDQINQVVVYLLGFSAVILIGYFYFLFYRAGMVNDLNDGTAKLNIARRMFDNPSGMFSLAQLGGVWLPMQSALDALTIWIDPLYHTGFSGSMWSMISFVGTGVVLFLIVKELVPSSRFAGFVGGTTAAAVYLLNVNTLYLGVTPMAESLTMLSMSLCALTLLRFERNPSSWSRFILASLALGFSILVHYELWFVAILSVPFVGIAMCKQAKGGREWLARMFVLYFPTISFMGAWMVFWEWQLYKSPLYFLTGPYSARQLDVVGNDLPAVHNISITLRQYFTAVRWNTEDVVFYAGLGGILLFTLLVMVRLEKQVTPAYLLGLPVFFIVSLYTGQSGLNMGSTPETSSGLRYGTVALPLIAFGVGYLAAQAGRLNLSWVSAHGKVLSLAILAVTMTVSMSTWSNILGNTVVTFRPGPNHVAVEEFGSWFEQNYDEGQILAQSRDEMDQIMFNAKIDLGKYITESSPVLWEKAKADPDSMVEWVLVKKGDRIDQEVTLSPQFQQAFTLKFENAFGRIYRGR